MRRQTARTWTARVLIEQPRTDALGDIVVDRFTTFVYDVRTMVGVKRRLRSMLPDLRRQGLRMNKQDFRRSFDNLVITRL